MIFFNVVGGLLYFVRQRRIYYIWKKCYIKLEYSIKSLRAKIIEWYDNTTSDRQLFRSITIGRSK